MKTGLFGVAAVLAVIASPVLALVGHGHPQTGGVALVVAPFWGPPIAEILAVSKLVDAFPGRAPMGAFVVIDDAQDLTTLYESGAWFVLSGEKVLELC